MSLFKLIIYVFVITIFTYSCKNEKNNITKNIEISSETVKGFQNILADYSLNGHSFNFIRGYLILEPIFNSKFISNNDTLNNTYFKLEENDTSHLYIGVNRLGCFVTILSKLNNDYFPNNSLIFPANLDFLKHENISISCINNDSNTFREVSFDKNIIREWTLDSIKSYRKTYLSQDTFYKMEIFDNELIFDNKHHYTYTHTGYEFKIDESHYHFYKVFVGEKYMILINGFNNSYEEYYFKAN
jgi:hypothetical protein